MGVQGWGGGRSDRVVLIDNGRVYQSKAADALVQVKTTTFGTNVGLNMLLNISSRYFGGLFWSRQLRGLPSSDGYFLTCLGKQAITWKGLLKLCLWISLLGKSLPRRNNGHDGISNHQPYDCLLNCLFWGRSKKTSKLHFTGLCAWKFTGDRWILRTNGQ